MVAAVGVWVGGSEESPDRSRVMVVVGVMGVVGCGSEVSMGCGSEVSVDCGSKVSASESVVREISWGSSRRASMDTSSDDGLGSIGCGAGGSRTYISYSMSL